MYLNTLKPAAGSKKSPKRLGRGIGSGKGKTCGKGHKGQHARAGGYHKVGFEGGQMPLQRRLPKFGFNSKKLRFVAEVRLDALNKLDVEEVNLQTLKDAHIVSSITKFVKIIKAGELSSTLKFVINPAIRITKGALVVLEAAGARIGE